MNLHFPPASASTVKGKCFPSTHPHSGGAQNLDITPLCLEESTKTSSTYGNSPDGQIRHLFRDAKSRCPNRVNKTGVGWSVVTTAEAPLAPSAAGKITPPRFLRASRNRQERGKRTTKAGKRKRPQPPAEGQPGTLLVHQRKGQEPTRALLSMSEPGPPRLVDLFLESKFQKLNNHPHPELRSWVPQD